MNKKIILILILIPVFLSASKRITAFSPPNQQALVQCSEMLQSMQGRDIPEEDQAQFVRDVMCVVRRQEEYEKTRKLNQK